MKRVVAVFILAGFTLAPPATAASAPPVAARFLDLFDRLRAAEAQKAHGPYPRISFDLSDGELNEYLQYALRATPRPGLNSFTVKLFPHNYVSTFVIVDFDAVERWKPGTIPALLRPFLSGKRSIWVDYRFQAGNARATFSVEKAYYQKLRLPAFFVEKVIHIVAERQPEEYDTARPLQLPFGLERIWTADHHVMGVN